MSAFSLFVLLVLFVVGLLQFWNHRRVSDSVVCGAIAILLVHLSAWSAGCSAAHRELAAIPMEHVRDAVYGECERTGGTFTAGGIQAALLVSLCARRTALDGGTP